MTKSNSLRSLKKRRRSVSSVKKKERRLEKPSAISSLHQSEDLVAEHKAKVTDSRHEQGLQKEQDSEWFGWWNGSTLTDFYTWCQSSVKEVSRI